MPYPSTLSAFTNPGPNDRLSTTPHSTIETNQNTALTEIETFVGTSSSAQGTLIYDIRSPNSNGGGHVQSANTGGTGQTTFNKGDILVGQSSSVITKLSVGADGTVPTANSAAAAGITWQGVANATNIQNQTYTYARASIMSGSVYGVNLGQAVSVLTDGMGFVVRFPNNNTTSLIALTVNAQGPSSLTALLKKTDLTNFNTNDIQASMIGLVEFDSVSSVFQTITSRPTQVYRTVFTANSTTNNTITPGFQPRTVNVHAVGVLNGGVFASSHGGWDSVNGNMCAGLDTQNGAAISTTQCLHVGTANNANTLTGSISSVVGTTFTLTTVLAGTQSAAVYLECHQ